MNIDRHEQISSFFSEKERPSLKNVSYAKYGYGLLFAGVIAFYLSYAGYIDDKFLFAVIFTVAGLFLIRNKFVELFFSEDSFFFDESEVPKRFLEDANEVVLKRVFEIAGIDKKEVSDDVIFKIYVPLYEQYPGVDSDKILRVLLENGKFMYSAWQVHVIIVESKFVSFYSCVYNWINNICKDFVTDEFYYYDIAAVKTVLSEESCRCVDNIVIENGQVKKVIITNISGDKIELTVDRPFLKPYFANDEYDLVKTLRMRVRKERFRDVSGSDIDFEIEDTRG
ncbi:MAG: hypothetical protein GXO50_00605 [Chlorobi bacterium]|nr:hypothetical protein [Chlorobiota bacterium]